jgi:hypothetical protein
VNAVNRVNAYTEAETVRRCIVPDCPTLITSGSRCPEHRGQQRQKYKAGWAALSRAAVAAHIAANGNWCPGHRRDPHASSDFTLDHASGRACVADVTPEAGTWETDEKNDSRSFPRPHRAAPAESIYTLGGRRGI